MQTTKHKFGGYWTAYPGARNLDLDVGAVSVDGDRLTVSEMHDAGLIQRVRSVDFMHRSTLVYAVEVEVTFYPDDHPQYPGRETGSTYYPVYKRTHDALLATGAYDDNGWRRSDA